MVLCQSCAGGIWGRRVRCIQVEWYYAKVVRTVFGDVACAASSFQTNVLSGIVRRFKVNRKGWTAKAKREGEMLCVTGATVGGSLGRVTAFFCGLLIFFLFSFAICTAL